jgi:hypothetical protein
MRFALRHLRLLAMMVVVAAWAARFAVGGAVYADDDVASTPATQAAVTPSHLIESHDCWSERAPADMRDRLPGHVVVTTRSGRTVYGGPRLVGKALDQQFAHKPAGLTVWGFCR